MLCESIYDVTCQACPRLSEFLATIRQQTPDYHALPVAPFGAEHAQLLIVGLAPGMHGANATGRPFTGDYAGLLLYKALFHFGYSNQADSVAMNDGLELINCRITNAVKCLPPQNKPTASEIKQCNHFLRAELTSIDQNAVILALGTIAHQAVLRAYAMPLKSAAFAHNVVHPLADGRYLIDSYHTSRYNVQTKRLNEAMFFDVFKNIENILNA
jgi:uracil-DNA glycosylase family 4